MFTLAPSASGSSALQTTSALLVEIVWIGSKRSGAILEPAIDQHSGDGENRNGEEAQRRAMGSSGRRAGRGPSPGES